MTILGADNFTNNGRTLTNGWNQSYDTQTWQVLSGGASHWSVVGNKGQITGATGTQVGALGSGTSVDQDIRVRVSVSNTADGVSVSGRMTASNTAYRARLQSSVFSLLVVVSGTLTVLTSTSFTTTASTNYQLHLRLRGSTISGNVWTDGTTEPAGFLLTTTDAQITAAGQYGVSTTLAVSTDIALYDQFVATNPTQITDSPYGVTIGLNPPGTNPSPYSNWHSLFADFFALGLSWLRFQLSWSLIQQHQNDPVAAWSWGPLDNAVQRSNEAGVNFLYTIRGAPSWALVTASQQASNEPWYIMDPTMTGSFASAVASRYNGGAQGTINQFGYNEDFNIHFSANGVLGIYNSPYNEYNALSGANNNRQPARDPHFFAPVMTQVAPAIRAVIPGAVVGAACVWWRRHPNTLDFYADLYREVTNASTYFSFADFHFYSNAADPSLAGSGTNYNPSYQQAWQDIQQACTNAGDPGKPCYNTEFGWATNANGGTTIDCTAGVQATRYAYILNNAKGSAFVTKVFFFTLDYKTQDVNNNPITDGSSVVQWDVPSQTYIKQPAWTTIQGFIAANPTWTPPVTLTVPAVSRRSGGTLATIARRDATGVVALKRRDGSGIAADKRRDGAVPADKRRDGAVTTTRRRG